MEESDGKDLEVKGSGVVNDAASSEIDNLAIALSTSCTLADDALIQTYPQSSGVGSETRSLEQSRLLELDTTMDMAHTNEHIEQMPQLLKTPEPEISKNNVKFNLRKSLAWNDDFFKSDGILDAEELSTMLEGGGKGVKNQLPGIEEEVYRSMDSISTLESDNLTLECLDAELFQDIRASIQKSSRAANLTNSCIKGSSGKKDSLAKASSSSKKTDVASGKRVLIKPAVRTKDSTSSIPPQPPKISNKVNPTSSTVTGKRASLSVNHDIAKQSLVAHKGTQPSKSTTQASKLTTQASKSTRAIGPKRGVPKPLLSSKSTSGGFSKATKIEPTRLSSSSSGSSSGTNVKSMATVSRNKIDPRIGKVTAASNSIPKTPSRIGLKNKNLAVNSRISSVSPSSSISEWSSESSSSTSNVNRKSISRGSIDTNVSRRSIDSNASAESASNGTKTVELPPLQTSSVSRPSSVQPTGLRMPSPKIGFFDGGKSGNRTPTGGIRSQSRLSTGLPKTGVVRSSPTGISKDPKTAKLPPPKTPATHTILKPNSHKTTTQPSQEQSNTKAKASSAIRGVKGSPSTFPKVSNKKGVKINEINIKSFKSVNDEGDISELSSKIGINEDAKENGQPGMQKKVASCDEFNVSNEYFVDGKDKSIMDNSRTPFAVKNSVCDTNESDLMRGSGIEVTEKTGNFPFMETGHKENGEVI